MNRYNTVCAWCGETLRTDAEVEHSHGICPACAGRIMSEWLQEKKEKEAAGGR